METRFQLEHVASNEEGTLGRLKLHFDTALTLL